MKRSHLIRSKIFVNHHKLKVGILIYFCWEIVFPQIFNSFEQYFERLNDHKSHGHQRLRIGFVTQAQF